MATRRARKIAPARLEVLPPKRLEAQYRAALNRRLDDLAKMLLSDVAALVERLGPEIDDRAREDTTASTIAEFIASFRTISIRFGRRRTRAEVEDLAKRLGADLSAFNKRRVERWFKAVFGVDPLLGDADLQALLAEFEVKNLAFITTLEEKLVTQVEGQITTALRSGVRADELAGIIAERVGVAKSGVKLIARDQIATLNGQLNEQRQTALGIESYTWLTAEDERVREEHEDRNGQVFRWDSPPSDGHPGEPINCRCVALPMIEDVLPEAFAEEP